MVEEVSKRTLLEKEKIRQHIQEKRGKLCGLKTTVGGLRESLKDKDDVFLIRAYEFDSSVAEAILKLLGKLTL